MQDIKHNENGVASIFVAMTIAIVLTLTVLGFAGIMRRERRQALDQQLSNQAFYAAESALNDKVAELRDDPSLATTTADCDPESDTFTGSDAAQTTCVLIDSAPGELEYDEVTTDGSTIVVLEPAGGGTFDNLIISWENKDGGGNCSLSSYSSFPSSIAPSDIGVIRADITKLSDYSRDGLRANTYSALLIPRSGGTLADGFNTNPVSESPSVFGSCDGSPGYVAKASIAVNSSDSFLLRLRGVYHSSRVRVQSENGTEFDGSQIRIDSTAKVQDVVRRIQARVPLNTIPGEYSDNALRSTDSVCKLIETIPSATNFSAGSCP